MKIHEGDTNICKDEIERCEDINDLKELLDKKSDYYLQWKNYINYLVEKNHLNYIQLGKICKSSKNTVKRWCKEGKLPQNREAFLKIALGFKMTVEHTNDLLRCFGKYPALYAKCMEDAIAIYALTNPKDNIDSYDYYIMLKNECLLYISDKKKRVKRDDEIDTDILYKNLISKESKEDFIKFLKNNMEIFENSYHKLTNYIDIFITSKSSTIHEFVEEKGLNAAFDKMISNLRNKGEVPNRIKLIILGVHLNMSVNELNKMLSLAYMEPLCVKDKIEAVVLYAIESAYLNNPTYAYENAVALKDLITDEDWRKKYIQIIKDYWDLSLYDGVDTTVEEYDKLIENISSYLRWILQEMDMDNEEIISLL